MSIAEDFEKDAWAARVKYKALLDLSESHLDMLASTGTVCDYYGADAGEHEFRLDEVVFKVIPDPDDGYRSSLGAVTYGDPTQAQGLMFHQPIARVIVQKGSWDSECDYDGPTEGYRLIDSITSHIWLEFGTGNASDYYPYFVFTHNPAPGPLTEII